MKKFLFLVLCCTGVTAAQAMTPETFSSGGIAANFTDIKGKWKALPVQVHISETANVLRFTFLTGVKQGDHTFRKAVKDTPAVVQDESIELQIAPDFKSKVYYHIGVNPAGTLYTACKRDVSWEPAGLKVDTKEWSKVTIELPFAALGLKQPSRGSVWKINFCYSRSKGSYREHFSWSGTKDFHDVSSYGTLRFGSSRAPQVLLGQQSSVSADAEVRGGKGLVLELEEEGRLWKGQLSNTGEWHFEAPVRYELPLKSCTKRTFRLKNKNGKLLWQRTALSGFDNRPCLELDRYYYTPNEKKLFWKSAFKGEKEFFLSGPSPLKWRSSENAGSVKLPETPGRYLLTVRQGPYHLSRIIEILETVPLMRDCSGLWKKEGTLLTCNGRKRFLVGGSQTKVLQLHHGTCFNLAHITPGKMPGALELLQLPGKRLRRSAQGTGYVFAGDEKQVLEFFRDQAVKLNAQKLQISRVAYEAQMKSYLFVNGRYLEQDSAKLYLKLYQTLKKHAPHQLFSLQIDRQEQAGRFAPGCDVFEVAVKGSYFADPMPGIVQEIRNIRKTVPDKVLIHWLGVTVPDNYSRSAEELRAELYAAFMSGSAGVLFHLGHGFLPRERSRLWSVISTTGAELDELMEEFHSGRAVDIKEPAGFRIALRDCGRYYLLVALNCSGRSARLKLQLPGRKYFNTAFAGLEARVFRIRK